MPAIAREASFIAPDTEFPTADFSRYRLVDLYKEVRLLMAQRHAIEYRLSCLLRVLDQREHVDGRPLYLASWLARTFGFGYGAAREKVRTARALGHLPLVDAAFREGKLSYSKVRALTRVATAENEGELLAAASHHHEATEIWKNALALPRRTPSDRSFEIPMRLDRARSLASSGRTREGLEEVRWVLMVQPDNSVARALAKDMAYE